jgi:ubiquinone biosynthesis protein UbiJ
MHHLAPITEKLLQFFINLLDKCDSEAFAPLQAHHQKVLKIQFTDLNIDLYFQVCPQQLKVSLEPPIERINTEIRGQSFQLLQLLLSREAPMATFNRHQLVLVGEVGLAQAFSQIFQQLDLDWEEALSYVLGDFMAHQLGQLLRAGHLWGKNFSQARFADLSEFIREEAKWLPTTAEVSFFLEQIDHLRDATERLALRVQRLSVTL